MNEYETPSSDVPAFADVERTLRRDRVVVRKRRARRERQREWSARRSRQRTVRTFAVCVGVLLVMAGILYFGLSRQETAAEGQSPRWGAPIALGG
jgi:anti-sigma factor RsiW